MNRLGLMHRSELSPEGKDLFDAFHDFTMSKYGDPETIGWRVTYKLKDGRFIGPFGALLHTPAVGHHFIGMATTIKEMSNLSDKHREIAILTTGAHFGAKFELWTHEFMAERYGLSASECDAILKGQRPESFDEPEKAVYDVAYEAVKKPGPLSKATWKRAVELLGKECAVAVVHYVAFYSYISVVLNGFDCKIPTIED